MVTDKQVRILMKALHTEKSKATAAAKAGMDEKTARKYERLGNFQVNSMLNITGAPEKILLRISGRKSWLS